VDNSQFFLYKEEWLISWIHIIYIMLYCNLPEINVGRTRWIDKYSFEFSLSLALDDHFELAFFATTVKILSTFWGDNIGTTVLGLEGFSKWNKPPEKLNY
jgi:hypothetical protein